MALMLTIAGADRTSYLLFGTLQIEDAISERSTCDFALHAEQGSLSLSPGQPVSLALNGQNLFGGTIDSIDEQRLSGTQHVRYDAHCADWHQVCDRRIMAETYQSIKAGAVIADLLTKHLADDGIRAGTANAFLGAAFAPVVGAHTVQVGPHVLEAVFNYSPLTNALDAMAERAGYAWWIDADKVLHFVERSTYAAPWAVTSSSAIRNVQVTRHRQGYRNRQYIKAGKDVTDPQTETFKGDGASRTFTVGFPIAKVPTVKVNGITKTVGIKGVETGKDWYWNKGDAVVTQDQAGTVLTSADTLEIAYQGFFDVVVLTTNEDAISERQTAEGGTGWYETVEDAPYLTSRNAAIQDGNAKLRRYAQMGKKLSFETFDSGLKPGQIAQVNLPEHGLLGDYLIERITFSDIPAADRYSWSVEAVSGEAVGGWARFFRNMATRGQAFVVRENILEDQVLIRLVQSEEGWQWADALTQTVYACPIPSQDSEVFLSPNQYAMAGLYPATDLYPC